MGVGDKGIEREFRESLEVELVEVGYYSNVEIGYSYIKYWVMVFFF